MKRSFSHIRSLAGIFALVTLVSGCGSEDSQTRARVRVFHALPDATQISVTIDKDDAVESLPYGSESSDFEVDEGTRRVRVDVNGLLASVIDENQSFNSEQSYRIYVTGPLSDATLLVRRDLASDSPNDGEFRVRIANISPQKRSYDVYIVGPDDSLTDAIPVTEGLTYKVISKFFDIPQGVIEIILTDHGTKTVELDSGPLAISSQSNYTYNVIDQPQGGDPLLGVLVSDD